MGYPTRVNVLKTGNEHVVCMTRNLRLVGRYAVPGLISLLLWLTACRIQTYAIAHDPGQYIQMGRILAEDPWRSDLSREALTFVAPVYPLVLALVVKVFGLLAPYWLNLVLMAGCVAMLTLMIRKWSESGLERDVVVLAACFLLFAGYRQNAYFLLYPFRETLSFFLILSAFASLVSIRESSYRLKGMLAGVCLLLAIGTREPSVCALPGALWCAWWVARKNHIRPWRVCACLILPFMAVVTVALPILLVVGRGANLQLASWLDVVGRQSPAILLSRTLDGMLALWGFLKDELGPLGLVLVAGGLLHWRRHIETWGCFIFTGFLFFVFYSHVGEPHRRFFLAVMVFTVPLVGAGLCGAVKVLSLPLERFPKLRSVRTWGYAVCLVAISIGWLRLLPTLHPWGPFVSRQEIVRMRDITQPLSLQPSQPVKSTRSNGLHALPSACQGLLKPYRFEAEQPFLVRFRRGSDDEPLFCVEKNNDVLKAALAGHTTVRFGVERFVYDELIRGVPVYYIKPLGNACFFQGRMIPDQGPTVEAMLQQYADLVPITGPDGNPIECTLGDGRYAFYHVQPWSMKQAVRPLPLRREGDSILCVDARALHCGRMGDEATTRLRIGNRVVDDQVNPGANYYYLPDSVGSNAFVTLESDQPVPVDFAPSWLSADQALDLDLSRFAFPMQGSIVQEGWEYVGSCWQSTNRAALHLPVPGPVPGMLLVELSLRVKSSAGDSGTVTVLDGASIIRSFDVVRGNMLHRLLVPVDRAGGFKRIGLQPDLSTSSRLLIDRVRVRMLSAGTRLKCDVGSADDDLFLGAGFHARERDAVRRSWRWTRDEAFVNLYFPSHDRDWNLEVRFSEQHRSPRAQPAQVAWSFNGSPVVPALEDAGDGWLLAAFRLQPSRDTAATNRLEIRCVPWSASVCDGTPDTRQLGIMVDRIDWMPASGKP